MTQTRRPPGTGTPSRRPNGARLWLDAAAAVVAGALAMWGVATLGLWTAGAGELPAGALPRVAAAATVLAVGGNVELFGDAGGLAETDAAIEAVPLSLTLLGGAVTGLLFLLPLRRRRPRAGLGEVGARAARTAVLWLGVLALLTVVARYTFRISLGESGGLADIGELLGVTPQVGFRAEPAATLGFGLLWLLAVLLLACLLSGTVPLPDGPARALRACARAWWLVLLGSIVAAAVTGVVVAATKGRPADTFAVMLLALPNLAWIGLGLGVGGAWRGHVEEGIGLPLPQALDRVLRTPDGRDTTLDLGSFSAQDDRAWLVVLLTAVLLLAAGFLVARQAPPLPGAGKPVLRVLRDALLTALAVGAALLTVGLLTPLDARYGLTLLGLGDLGGGLGGEVTLAPLLGTLVGWGLLWGFVAGALGGLLATAAARGRGARR